MLRKNKIQAQQPQLPRISLFSRIRNYPPISKAHIAGILSIVLVLGTILTACSLSKRRTGEIYLIPKGYIGKVYIFYGQPNGQQEEWENKNRVFRIGKNGRIFVKDRPYYGPFESDSVRYYYEDSLGNRTPIQEWEPIYRDEYDKNEIMIFGHSIGDCTCDPEKTIKFYWADFDVNAYKDLKDDTTDLCEEYLKQ